MGGPLPSWLYDASQAVYGVTFVVFVVVLIARANREATSNPIQLVRRSPLLQVLLLVLAVTVLISFVDLGLMIKHWVGA